MYKREPVIEWFAYHR